VNKCDSQLVMATAYPLKQRHCCD